MIKGFEILNETSARPVAERIIFCDGTDGRLFQAGTDLELSHWRPNRTPTEYRAGTSTEICFHFLDNPLPGLWTVAVNNHVDVDGILSIYVLVHSQHALAHRKTIIAAAEMGDFWSWGDAPAQRVFQGLTRLMNSRDDGGEIYAEAFRRIPGLIDGTDPEARQINESLAPLQRCIEQIEQGLIARSLIGQRLAHYVVPLETAGDDDDRASYCPEFNEAISDKCILWPQARARWDAQRLCVVSVERTSGWFHDLWFPGYWWADTEGCWQIPGLTFHNGMLGYTIDHQLLASVFEDLQRLETAEGSWGLGGTHLPFGMDLRKQFPLGGRFLDLSGRAAASHLSPEQVATAFQKSSGPDEGPH